MSLPLQAIQNALRDDLTKSYTKLFVDFLNKENPTDETTGQHFYLPSSPSLKRKHSVNNTDMVDLIMQKVASWKDYVLNEVDNTISKVVEDVQSSNSATITEAKARSDASQKRSSIFDVMNPVATNNQTSDMQKTIDAGIGNPDTEHTVLTADSVAMSSELAATIQEANGGVAKALIELKTQTSHQDNQGDEDNEDDQVDKEASGDEECEEDRMEGVVGGGQAIDDGTGDEESSDAAGLESAQDDAMQESPTEEDNYMEKIKHLGSKAARIAKRQKVKLDKKVAKQQNASDLQMNLKQLKEVERSIKSIDPMCQMPSLNELTQVIRPTTYKHASIVTSRFMILQFVELVEAWRLKNRNVHAQTPKTTHSSRAQNLAIQIGESLRKIDTGTANSKLGPLETRLGQFDLARGIEKHMKDENREKASTAFISDILKASQWTRSRLDDNRKYGRKWLNYCRFTRDGKTVFRRGLLCFMPLAKCKAFEVTKYDYLEAKNSDDWKMFVRLLDTPSLDILCHAGEALLDAMDNGTNIRFYWEKEERRPNKADWLEQSDDDIEWWLVFDNGEDEE
ncbi:hypothetical protein F53441_13612 [Fusarium austroafricanum]|uniref:Uncharacterized protein n=1 Tax=Fusarium austroafricanum TaxID=2364996 RepID=A0A8H4JQ05_9HYPO|nr:hypothetical protein F53441_13612 [Fusarium austroafricanum]